MSTDKPENHTNDPSKKPASKTHPKAIVRKSQNTNNDHVRDNSSAQYEQFPNEPKVDNIDKIPQIDIVEGIEANQIARKANFISTVAVIVNAIILFVTGTLAIISLNESKSANSAAITAENTFKETKKFDSTTLANQKIADKKADSTDSIKSKKESITFAFQKTSDSTQIQNLEETQKEFEIENRPLPQVYNFSFNPLRVGKNIIVKYDFVNFGKQPVKCLQNKMEVEYGPNEKKPIPDPKTWIYVSMGSYMGSGGIAHQEWKSDSIISNDDSTYIVSGQYSLYLIGKLTFRNNVTFKESAFIYTYRLYYTNGAFSVECITDTTMVAKNAIKIP